DDVVDRIADFSDEPGPVTGKAHGEVAVSDSQENPKDLAQLAFLGGGTEQRRITFALPTGVCSRHVLLPREIENYKLARGRSLLFRLRVRSTKTATFLRTISGSSGLMR